MLPHDLLISRRAAGRAHFQAVTIPIRSVIFGWPVRRPDRESFPNQEGSQILNKVPPLHGPECMSGLTAQREALLTAISGKWLRVGLCMEPADRPAAKQGIRAAYRATPGGAGAMRDRRPERNG